MTLKKFLRKHKRDIKDDEVIYVYTDHRTVYNNFLRIYKLDIKYPGYKDLPNMIVKGWYIDNDVHYISVNYF